MARKSLVVCLLAAALAVPASGREAPKPGRSPYALSDEELAGIPPPSIPRLKSWMVGKVREAAKAGDLERVKSLIYDVEDAQPMDSFENYRNAVLEAMRLKAAVGKPP